MVVNVAVLGCGMVGKIIPPVMRQAGADITAVFGETNEEAKGLVQLLHLGDKVYTGSVKDDYQIAISANVVPIDVVYNGLPNFLHAGPNIAAANAGKHVFSEKPLAPTIDEVLTMRDAIVKNNVLFEVDSAYANHELPERIQKEIAERKLGRILFAEVIYDQDWQKAADAQIGWRPVIEIAGPGKLIPDLMFHGIYSMLKITGGKVEAIDGKAWNMHPVRWKLNNDRFKKYLAEKLGNPVDKIDLSNADTFGKIQAPGYAERQELYDAMQMLGPLPTGVTQQQTEALAKQGYDPRLFTGKYSGDDVAEANMWVTKDNYGFPVYMRASQVLKGKNEFTVKIICENGSYEWKQPDPNHMEVEEGGRQYIEHRGSNPGIFTSPPDHPAGYTTGVGLKVEPYIQKVAAAKAGQLQPADIEAWNGQILTKAVQTQFVLDQWLQLKPGFQQIQYRGAA